MAKKLSKKKRSGKKIGNAFELVVVRLIRSAVSKKYSDSICYRTPASGGHYIIGGADITIAPKLRKIFDFAVECKHRKTWAIRDWIRKCRQHEPFRWVIFAGDGDRRLSDSVGDVMVVDRQFGLELLDCWNDLTWTRKDLNGNTEET